MKKKMLALALAASMATVSLTGCGGSSTTTTEATTNEATDTEKETETSETADTATATDAADEEVPENEVIGNTNAEDAFYVYCWNADVMNNVITYFNETYPEDADRIVYVNTGGTDFYQTKIDALLDDPTNPQYPDMIAMEMDYIMKYTDSDYTLPVSELGITEADMKNMYQYTIDAATVNGQVKGLSWQACPGAMMYRRSLAEKYLGTSEPDKVQEFFKDWDTMLATGKKIVADSNGATKLFSGVDDVKRVYQAARETAWYDSNSKLTVEDTMLDYMDYAKALQDAGLTNGTTQWTDEWAANVQNDNTFAYMGCTWFLHWTLKANCGGTKAGEGTYGDWAMCAGPQPYYWGGTWLGATKDCSDKNLAGKIMKAATCDTEVMKNICKGSLDYVNNKEAIASLSEEGVGKFDFLGGQDFLSYFSPLAEEIELPAMCGEDFYITTAFDDQVTSYVNGDKDKETAVKDFKSYVVDLYPYLSAE
ncbi:ABC-type glycerol-3-phosphate transport system substrate-binding protein [Lachnotalea glycerini]|uniref:ABC-type glycerol-3-phosphate transport system substrate-binding protein n=1 Tax=Lachnotalea glycerini TaxID=1763509 RepID=A0A318EHB9_9FIRM|nr:ABC transporter substrate-binding protein [Lachnotalea glycerini]PXV85680.1 ABC-type glycerol-3-phosphate transport system substrate-binding protein [Lachnotalea glycerini]